MTKKITALQGGICASSFVLRHCAVVLRHWFLSSFVLRHSSFCPVAPVLTSFEKMVDNAPFLTHQHAGLTIEGYSRAAVQTYWRIAELKLGFDLGAQPWDFMGTSKWFVTHTHLDHIAALPVYVARRRMMKM